MPLSDILVVIQWWSTLFLLGAAAFPLTKRLFSSWYDKGYLFSKAVGFAVIPYLVYVVGTFHIAPFATWTTYGAMLVVFIFGISLQKKGAVNRFVQLKDKYEKYMVILGIEEVIFFLLLLLWAFVKAHEPSIRGLEKFMDYGFMQSILTTRFFPAPDMWWAGGSINYYYFGHLVTALLTKLSGLSLGYTFNLMLATIFALTATMSFSIGYQILFMGQHKRMSIAGKIIGGTLTAFLVTMAGNMQTIYAFTKGYTGEDVLPFWQLLWPIGEFFSSLNKGMMTYWYANATRFIPFSIHEFPSYSFVVSDVHGHVLSLPFVLLAIASLIHFFVGLSQKKPHISGWLVWYGFLLGVLLMTNALDGPIYGGIFAVCWLIFVILPNKRQFAQRWWEYLYPVGLVALLALVAALPFLFFFDSFATGIGVNCPPAFLAGSKIGPFLFEEVEKCQRSPLWMMWLLWGFFWFTGAWMFIQKLWNGEGKNEAVIRILKVFFLFSIGLIIFPEFLYVKDIYPAHFRSNTMFKLGYQAFIMWSVIAGYVIMHLLRKRKDAVKIYGVRSTLVRLIFLVLVIPQLFLVSIYPIFSIRSYFGELQTYRGIWGLGWMEEEYPDNLKAIEWLNGQVAQVKTQERPVIVEADGESYTDDNQISVFTGVPTITGWAVHEWLWRGTYETVSPRRDDVRIIYESSKISEIERVLEKYNITYIIVGPQEREKYPNIQEEMFDVVGNRVFTVGDMTIWETRKR